MTSQYLHRKIRELVKSKNEGVWVGVWDEPSSNGMGAWVYLSSAYNPDNIQFDPDDEGNVFPFEGGSEHKYKGWQQCVYVSPESMKLKYGDCD